MKNCSTCSYILHPQGGWCYMFREEPIATSCAKHTLADSQATASWMPSPPDILTQFMPGPDSLMKIAQIGLNSYQELHVKTTEIVAKAASSVADVGASVLAAAGEAATAGMDAVCSVGEAAGDIASGCADVAGSLLD